MAGLIKAHSKLAFEHILNNVLDCGDKSTLKLALLSEGFADIGDFNGISFDFNRQFIDDLKRTDRHLLWCFREYKFCRIEEGNPIKDWMSVTRDSFLSFCSHYGYMEYITPNEEEIEDVSDDFEQLTVSSYISNGEDTTSGNVLEIESPVILVQKVRKHEVQEMTDFPSFNVNQELSSGENCSMEDQVPTGDNVPVSEEDVSSTATRVPTHYAKGRIILRDQSTGSNSPGIFSTGSFSTILLVYNLLLFQYPQLTSYQDSMISATFLGHEFMTMLVCLEQGIT
jgi:hypothetical protein